MATSTRKIEVEVLGDSKSLERAFGRSSRSAKEFNRDLSKSVRGVAAGSGAFKALGRSLAFASGGFLAGASISAFLKQSIEQGSEAAATQKQLAAQFKAAGQSLKPYQDEIDRTTLKVSQLAGFEDDQLKAAFITAFRGSQNVSVALRIQAIAADVARGRHIDLQAATLALTKAYGGQATALRRLGVLVPKNLHGLAALGFVQERFAGQAAAGTTAQDRFGAALKNTEQTIGLALLPTFNKLLGRLSKYLNNQENQKKISKDVNKGLSTTGKILSVFGHLAEGVIKPTEDVAHAIDKVSDASQRANRFLGRGVGRIFGASATQLSGEDVRLRSNAFRPTSSEDVRLRGAGSLGSSLPTGGGTAGRLGLLGRFKKADLALARAERTKASSDDRAALQVEAGLLKDEIESRRKAFRDKAGITRQLKGVEDQIAAIDKQAADSRKQAAENRKRRLEERRAAVLQSLQINIDRSGLTKGLGDDVKATAELLSTLKQQLRLDKNNLDIQEQIVAVEGSFLGLREQQREQAAARREIRQFRVLGLGPGGAALAPTKRALKNELGTIEASLKGTFLDTNANRSVLGKIRKLMRSQLGGLSADVRSTVKQMLDDLKNQVGDFDGFNLTKAEKRRRFLDKQLTGPVGSGGGSGGRRGQGGNVVHVHQTIVAAPGESVDSLARRQHFRAKQAFAH